MNIDSTAKGQDERPPTLLERYRRNADLPLMVLSLAVIPLIAVEFFGDVGPRAERGLEATYGLIWLAFLADYIIQLVLSENKRQYVRTEWLALVLVILTVPVPASPFVIFRAARSLRLLRLFRFGAIAARGAHRVVTFPSSVNSQLGVAVATFLMVTLVSAVLVFAVEEGRSESQIHTMGQSLWWAVTTVTTVGFGDVVPRTTAGRLFALVPMIAGVLFVATVASNFVERFYSGLARRLGHDVIEAEEHFESGVEQRLAEMTRQIEKLEATIRAAQAG